MVLLGMRVLVNVLLILLATATAQLESEGRKHWWPLARGSLGKYGITDIVGPSNLSASLAWNWEHSEMAIITGCLLDDRKNIYVASMNGIHKFSPDGRLVWHFPTLSPYSLWIPPGQFYNVAVPSLVDGALYGSGIGGPVFKVDVETGQAIWKVDVETGPSEMDTPYVQVYRGVVTFAHGREPDRAEPGRLGNCRVTAVNSSSGEVLWRYKSEMVLWNFHPTFPGDDTFVTMDIHGGLFRRGLLNGSVVWYTPPPRGSERSYSDGGQVLGPDGSIYSCASFGWGGGSVNSLGVLRKHDLGTGRLIWERQLPQPCVSWPAASAEMVVVPVGALPKPSPFTFDLAFLPMWAKLAMHWVSNTLLGSRQRLLWGNVPAPLAVMAFEPDTGLQRWVYDGIAPWTRVCSKGDEENMLARGDRWPWRPVCGPASWSSPTIGGDGTVYAGAMDGYLYAVRDANGDGAVEEGKEVSRLWTGSASLHGGPVFAPGLMAFPSCSGIWVFRW